jgi:hypothetical protein
MMAHHIHSHLAKKKREKRGKKEGKRKEKGESLYSLQRNVASKKRLFYFLKHIHVAIWTKVRPFFRVRTDIYCTDRQKESGLAVEPVNWTHG